jgi:putative membrane protein
MLQFWESHAAQLASALIYSLIGILMFGLTFLVVRKILPFNLIKELEEDQNIALGILLGSMMIGISLIIAAAIH